ncbi:MAG: hypothetical protein WDA18_05330 [Candidatus Ratteibacteria bacterium]
MTRRNSTAEKISSIITVDTFPCLNHITIPGSGFSLAQSQYDYYPA